MWLVKRNKEWYDTYGYRLGISGKRRCRMGSRIGRGKTRMAGDFVSRGIQTVMEG
ncbi:hypothetical protein AALC25_01710 [Lachnospiraceae bacterium 29-84]